jgi:hypothetical protein
MHEAVHSSVYSKLLSALRLPSFAGEGLPERMRSTSFALLGLTAAAGLALVAIFVQPGFSVLSPAPLPDQPSAGESVAEAKKLPLVHRPIAVLAAEPVHVQQAGGSPAVDSPASNPSGGAADGGETAAMPAVDVPDSTSAPEPSGGNSGGGGSGGVAGGGSGSTPAAAPDQAAASPSAPVTTPAPKPTAPASEGTTATAKPEPAPAPGNSGSAAAAEHASERGIEASASSGPPAGSGATTAAVMPETSPPGNGNGLAKGHDK